MALPSPPLPHDAIREAAWSQLWELLLAERPDGPPAPQPEAEDDGASDEAAA
jgi:hypothetical protein